MNPPEPHAGKRPFWKRRRFLVPATALMLVVVGIFLAAVVGPRNGLIDWMPGQRSTPRFLGPLQPPVNRAWQSLSSLWSKPPPKVRIDYHVVNRSSELLPLFGTPVLTNQAGVTAWILDPERLKSVMDRTNLVGNQGAWIGPPGKLGARVLQNHSVAVEPKPGSGHSTELSVVVAAGTFVASKNHARTTFPNAPTNHPALWPFGVRVTIPKGSSLLLLGPAVDFDPAARFCVLFVPE